MEVKIDKRYPLPVDPGRAWALLCDIRAVAGCMPGAQITEQESESAYKGLMKVKVGPAQAQFGGTVEVLELDPGSRRLSLRGKGADKGGSQASLELHATIEPAADDPARSTLHGDATLQVTGKFAQFGARMMVQVSEMLLGQFVEHFGSTAQQLPQPQAQPVSHDGAQAPPDASAAAWAPATAPGATPPQAPRELNGLAILWALFRNWLAGLFGRRRDG